MGMLVEGKWQDVWYDTKSTGGKFVRSTAGFRDWVTALVARLRMRGRSEAKVMIANMQGSS